ncbi:endothelin-converting enzyme 2-like [Dermacentor albipictus]|uniref:endothelin-converting enzyme 2-like n=1 Tax=Dermacentor albipictus TaxID=60249 RepID=UPI0031FC1A19
MDFRLTEPRLSPRQQALLLRVGLVLFVAAVILTTLVLVLTRSHHAMPLDLKAVAKKSPHGAAQLCNTTSCRLAASLLRETVSGDPCDDFYAYVCSGWLNRPSFTSTHDEQETRLWSHARSGLKHMAPSTTTTSRFGFTARITTQATKIPASKKPTYLDKATPSSVKAAMLFGECLEASTRHRADALVIFLGDVGLSFVNTTENPVELAIKLDLFYNLKTFFDLRLHPTWRHADGRRMLSMGRRLDLESWRIERVRLRRRGAYEELVHSHVIVMVLHANRSKVLLHGNLDINLIVHHIMATEESVLAVSGIIPEEDPDRYYAMIPLLSTSNSSNENDSSSSAPLTLQGLSEVAVGHPSFLAYRRFLAEEVGHSQAAAYVSWELARQLGPLTDRQLSRGISETKCFEAISRLMPYPTVMPYMEELDYSRGWEEAEMIFKDVSEAMISFMSQRGVTLPAIDASFELKLPTTGQLDAFYSELGEDQRMQEEPTFVDKYLSALSQIRSKELFSVVHMEEPSTSYPLPPLLGRQAQVTQRGEGRVPLTWLLPPRFGADFPPTLNYGAFGLELAAALLRGTPLDKSWLECLEQLEPQLNIRPENDITAQLALATEAVAAFVESHQKVGYRLVLPGLESVTEGMMFYMGACASMCTKDNMEVSYRCNLVARNSEGFARTFGCPVGSHMSPVERCSYPNVTQG